MYKLYLKDQSFHDRELQLYPKISMFIEGLGIKHLIVSQLQKK